MSYVVFHWLTITRWCFYINLTLGAVAIAVIFIFFKPPAQKKTSAASSKTRLSKFDISETIGLLNPCPTHDCVDVLKRIAMLVFMPAIICLILALQWGGTVHLWSSWRSILLLILFAVLFLIWLSIQFWKGDSATVPPCLIKNRSIAAASWYIFSLGSYILVLIYYLPLWFQAVKGTTAVESGIRNLPLILGLVVVSILTGIGVTISGYCKTRSFTKKNR